MTELEAAQKFKVEINKLDRSSLIDVRFEKVLHYLNKAALFLVKKKFRGPDPGPGRLELMHPVLDDLKVLLKEVTIDVADGLFPNTPVPFENDHLYYISCRIKTICPTGSNSSGWAEGRYVKPERVYKELNSPFNKSVFDDPVVTVSDNQLIIYNDGFDLDEEVIIKYLKAPNNISGGSTPMELPFADEIIDTAVSMALENFESQRVRTQPPISVANISE